MNNAVDARTYFAGRKVLVTGGAGMVGSHAVEMLVGWGAEVSVPVRRTTRLENLHGVKDRFRVVEADLFDAAATRAAVRGQQIVLHFAAAKGGGIAHSVGHHGSLFRDNMLGAINVLDAARDASVERMMVVSSACVYPRDCTCPTPEEDGTRDAPEPTNAGYGWSKRMVEYLAQAYAEQYGMNIGIARPYNTYGPRDDFFREYSHVIPGLIKRFLSGDLTVWGSGIQTRSFLYASDSARGVLEMCAHGSARGPYNIGTDEEVSIRELAELIRAALGIQTPVRFDSSKPDGQPRRCCDTRRAREVFGFEARVGIRDGVRLAIDWYLAEKKKREAR
jgi:GDP-L-fucose synthase